MEQMNEITMAHATTKKSSTIWAHSLQCCTNKVISNSQGLTTVQERFCHFAGAMGVSCLLFCRPHLTRGGSLPGRNQISPELLERHHSPHSLPG
jgi:hypothetical protein